MFLNTMKSEPTRNFEQRRADQKGVAHTKLKMYVLVVTSVLSEQNNTILSSFNKMQLMRNNFPAVCILIAQTVNVKWLQQTKQFNLTEL